VIVAQVFHVKLARNAIFVSLLNTAGTANLTATNALKMITPFAKNVLRTADYAIINSARNAAHSNVSIVKL